MAFVQDCIDTVVLIVSLMVLWPIYAVKKFLLPRSFKDVTQDIVLITGSGSGIGRLMAIKLAEKGATIISTDLNESTAKQTAETINENGGKAYSYQLDVTDRKKVYTLAEIIRGTVGDVTMLINNAGIVTGKKFLECPDNLLEKTFEVNVISHCWTLKAFLSSMMEKNKGHIVTIASIAGYCGSPGLVDYTASKFGAVGLHESLSTELANSAPGVKTTIVCPFFINTGMFAGVVSRSPWLLPIMCPDRTATRIVTGILSDEAEVFIPWIITLLTIVKVLFPMSLSLKMVEYFKLEEQMSDFVGRAKKE